MLLTYAVTVIQAVVHVVKEIQLIIVLLAPLIIYF